MDIKYIGHASFVIKTKAATVVTDPFDGKMVGIKYPKTEADIVTLSHKHPDHGEASQIGGSPLIIDWPGEFEKQGVRITGYPTFHDKTQGSERGENIMFKIEAEGLSLLHCGDLGHIPAENFLEEIGEVDVLFVPVGGFYTIDAKEAVELVRKLEPSIVIPMHFNKPELNQETFGKLLTVDEFIKNIGSEPEKVQKLSLKKEGMAEGMKVVIMESTS